MAGEQVIEGLVACRLYQAGENPAGAPPVEGIVNALIEAEGRNTVQAGSSVFQPRPVTGDEAGS